MTSKASQVLRAYKGMAIEARRWRTQDEFAAVETDYFVRTWTHPDHWEVADTILDRTGVKHK
jgi:hypothetical protein